MARKSKRVNGKNWSILVLLCVMVGILLIFLFAIKNKSTLYAMMDKPLADGKKTSQEDHPSQQGAFMEPLETTIARRKEILLDGKTYELKKDVVNILILGTDCRDTIQAREQLPRSAGQADVLILLSIDSARKIILPIQFDRDTVMEIKTLSVLGREAGTRFTQIARAHSFGSQPKEGAELTMWAISNFLYDLPIHHYISVNMDNIPHIVDYFGGVDITLQEDMMGLGEDFVKGATVHLEGPMVADYLRARQDVGDGSNHARMARHRQFLSAFKPLLQESINKGEKAIAKMQEGLKDYYSTDISKGKLINLAWESRSYTVADIFTFPGTYKINTNNQLEFHVYSDVLEAFLIDNYSRER